jgi:hypothetical protein
VQSGCGRAAGVCVLCACCPINLTADHGIYDGNAGDENYRLE